MSTELYLYKEGEPVTTASYGTATWDEVDFAPTANAPTYGTFKSSRTFTITDEYAMRAGERLAILKEYEALISGARELDSVEQYQLGLDIETHGPDLGKLIFIINGRDFDEDD